MKRILFFTFGLIISVFAQNSFAQTSSSSSSGSGGLLQMLSGGSGQGKPADFLQDIKNMPPDKQAEINQALQKGDYQTAFKIYKESKMKSGGDFMLDMQDMPPATAAKFKLALSKGDFKTAEKIYKDYKKKAALSKKDKKKRKKKFDDLKGTGLPGMEEDLEDSDLSLFEQKLSADLPEDIAEPIKQFGYDIFTQAVSTFTPSETFPVGSDYIIGPGDQFTLTLWGTTEGIFTFSVSKEGNITLPKVGVVHVAGLKFSELESALRRQLSRYFSSFNLSVAMGDLRTMTVYIVGEVSSPGSYSLSSLTTVFGALYAASGPTKTGTMRNVQVLRSGKVIKTIDLYDFLLKGDRSQDIRLQNEDTVFVPIIGQIAGVAGSVYRPAIYEFKGQETVGDLLKMAGGILPFAISGRLQVNRYFENHKKVILDMQVSKPSEIPSAYTNGMREKVQNMDLISILPMYDKVWEVVNLSGDVRNPGDYEWKPGIKLKDVILKGQLLQTTDMRRAEVIRLTKDYMDREILAIDLTALMDSDESQNILLQPRDHIRVYTTFREVEKITITGEVVRPGEYEMYKGERLSDLLKRVGGFTKEAYPYGTVFKRMNIMDIELKNSQVFISKMQTQILQSAAQSAATAISSEEAGFAKATMTLNQGIIDNLKALQEQFEGRVAINITAEIDDWSGSKNDLLLQDQDSIYIPKRPQEVMVMGEVYGPGAQIFQPGVTVRDYIEYSGGYTNNADRSKVYVVQANGFAFGEDSPSVGNIKNVKLNAGDSVFIPQKVERYAVLRFTKDIIDILFKTAVTLATITVLF